MKTKFEIQCEGVAEKHGVDVIFFDDIRKMSALEDDGNLHVIKRGLRACFGIGQDEKISIYNEKTEGILTDLGMGKFIGPNVLLEDECPHGCDEQGCRGECGCQECGERHSECTCEDEEEDEEG